MDSSTKITGFEIENVKRVKAVALTPSESGLTIIGGRNGQGKTSVLDAIAWALGGDKYRPSGAQREGSVLPPSLRIELSNGLIVERKGKNSDLKVIDPQGNRAGQTLLNEFIEQLALDLPKFMAATAKEKANILLRIIGVGEQLYQLEQMDPVTLRQFAEWLESEGLQAIATRVSLGDECAVIIEDGAVAENAAARETPAMPEAPTGGYWS